MSYADVIKATAEHCADGTYTFSVTVQHEDEGWDHYADRWEIIGPNDEVLATRVLLHPHVGEKSFTRTKAGVSIPETIERVRVRAHDSLHGYGGIETEVILIQLT